MASALREPIAGFWDSVLGAEPPAVQRGPGAIKAPGQGIRDEVLLKLKDIHFFDALRRAKFGYDFSVVLKSVQQSSVSSQ